jgi:acyl-CoA synthetase (AMP-forming)/AMP-acid ligase II
LHNLASGITSVIPDFPFPRPEAVQAGKVLRQVERLGVTTASGSPAYWWTIAEYCLKYGLALPLRQIVTGGAPVTPRLIQRLKQIAPGAEILSVYGSSEAEPVAVMPDHEILSETAALTASGAGIPLGHPVSDVAVRILGENGKKPETGAVGEIWVAGEHVARGYFSNPQADSVNKSLDADGCLWHRMGDLGYRDEHGRLWLAGRVHTTIARDGQSIYPVPVEAAVGTLPFIHRAALLGIRDSRLGERACLTVEFIPGVEKPAGWQSQVQALCASHGWIIDEIRAVGRIPMDARHNARIDYARLKSRL